jgi:DNA end-binding protein Ku
VLITKRECFVDAVPGGDVDDAVAAAKYLRQLRAVQNGRLDEHGSPRSKTVTSDIENDRRIAFFEQPGYEGLPEISRSSRQQQPHGLFRSPRAKLAQVLKYLKILGLSGNERACAAGGVTGAPGSLPDREELWFVKSALSLWRGGFPMPRANWKGFLRLSLVSCPIYLSPAATRTKSIRLHQVWQPKDRRGAPIEVDEEDEQPSRPATRSFNEDFDDTRPQPPDPTRVALRPHDPQTGEEIEREEVAKGYEYERGQFVTFTPAELKALDVESSKIIDLETFVPRAEVDPVYFSNPYYVYPDGPIAVETFRVIGAAMTEAGEVGIGRVTLSRRERPVMVEPRGAGMVLITLRASEEVRAAAFEKSDAQIDPDMVAIAGTIIKRRSGHFDPTLFRDRYQEALRESVSARSIRGRTYCLGHQQR